MPNDTILVWADFAEERRGHPGSIQNHREATYSDYLARLWEFYHEGAFTPVALPLKPSALPSIAAFVNAGRWMVTCDCGQSSAPAQPGQDFLCPVCEEWHSVMFPELKVEIEGFLLARPGHRLNGAGQRNWPEG